MEAQLRKTAGTARRPARRLSVLSRVTVPIRRFLGHHFFSSLTRRILFVNLAGLAVMVTGILYLNTFRDGLIDARVESLMTQGEIIAGAIASSATVETDSISIDPEKLLELQAGQSIGPGSDQLDSLDFPINPERVAPLLRRLISPTRTRARVYDRDAVLLLDSRRLYSRGQILRYDLPAIDGEQPNILERVEKFVFDLFRNRDLPIYHEQPGGNGTAYPEVMKALTGSPSTIVRISEQGEQIVSVAVPIQRFRAVLGVLMLSTQGGDIDKIVADERQLVADPQIDCIVTTGGTGVTGRDVTPEAFKQVMEKEIEGFGELFRRLSYQKIGTSTMQSRAIGGVAGGTYLFALPGSPGACKDGWEDILKFQLDSRHKPCNLVELMPRLKEHLKAAS